MPKLLLYFNTLKYLKFTQIYHRVLKKIKHPKIRDVEGLRSLGEGAWITQEIHTQKFLNETDVEFLNHKGSVIHSSDWNNSKEEKLWLYNLHYFDDLSSIGSHARSKLQLQWIEKWIAENAAKDGGNGWESYTLSLRIVNWTKACLSGLAADKQLLDSLAQQADFLSQDLEKHLLGNHYFVNLKALLFAGCFFDGRDANKWLTLALKDYEKELNEQVLNDGGSFELTPMYHAIMLTDLLDLYNLFMVYPSKVSDSVIELTKKKIIVMLAWLNIMSHGDDKISFFNDSAFGIAPENSIIREYAKRLGVDSLGYNQSKNSLQFINQDDSGYISVKSNQFTLIADLAEVGPSYQPGHAHADTLSFEFTLFGNRVFVNSGTSEYGTTRERLRQRGTSVHNTVVVNNLNSSQVWSGFRVAKRANVIKKFISDNDNGVTFGGSHNGFKLQGVNCIHQRTWIVEPNKVEVEDILIGEFHSAISFLHLHPNIKIKITDNENILLITGREIIHLKIFGATIKVEDSTWHPEFGVVQASNMLYFEFESRKMRFQFSW